MSVPPALIDTIFVALILFTTYVLTSEGAWGAALMFFNVLFGAMIASMRERPGPLGAALRAISGED